MTDPYAHHQPDLDYRLAPLTLSITGTSSVLSGCGRSVERKGEQYESLTRFSHLWHSIDITQQRETNMCAEFFSAEKAKTTQNPEVQSPDGVEKTTAGDGSELDAPTSNSNVLQDEALSMAYLPHLNNYVDGIRQVDKGNKEYTVGLVTALGLASMKTVVQARLGKVGIVAGAALSGLGLWDEHQGRQKVEAELPHLQTSNLKELLEKGQEVKNRTNTMPLVLGAAVLTSRIAPTSWRGNGHIHGALAYAPVSLYLGHKDMQEFEKLADQAKESPPQMFIEMPTELPTKAPETQLPVEPPSSEPAETVLPKVQITSPGSTPELTPDYFNQFMRKKN